MAEARGTPTLRRASLGRSAWILPTLRPSVRAFSAGPRKGRAFPRPLASFCVGVVRILSTLCGNMFEVSANLHSALLGNFRGACKMLRDILERHDPTPDPRRRPTPTSRVRPARQTHKENNRGMATSPERALSQRAKRCRLLAERARKSDPRKVPPKKRRCTPLPLRLPLRLGRATIVLYRDPGARGPQGR